MAMEASIKYYEISMITTATKAAVKNITNADVKTISLPRYIMRKNIAARKAPFVVSCTSETLNIARV